MKTSTVLSIVGMILGLFCGLLNHLYSNQLETNKALWRQMGELQKQVEACQMQNAEQRGYLNVVVSHLAWKN